MLGRRHLQSMSWFPAWALAISVSGCSSAPLPSDAPMCEDSAVSDDVAWSEQYLGMTPAQQSAVARLSGTVDDELSYCSGALVAPGYLLTAAHCLELVEADDALVMGSDETATVEAALLHSELDVMLLVLRWEEDAPQARSTLALLAADLDARWLDERVVAAGFGRTDRVLAGSRHFSVQTVSALEENLIEVTPVGGLGEFGVCSGDSGGPLLVRGGDDEVRLAGVLSTASANCRGLAYYTRVDAVRGWLREQGVELGAAAPSSGPATRACEERCDGDIALRCGEGGFTGVDCSDCDATCIISPGSARAGCF